LKIKNFLKGLLSILWIVIPFLLWVIPADFLDDKPPICPSVIILKMECFGCGMTRATLHLMHLEFETAWNFNKLIFIVFPFLVIVYLHVLGKIINYPMFNWVKKFY